MLTDLQMAALRVGANNRTRWATPPGCTWEYADRVIKTFYEWPGRVALTQSSPSTRKQVRQMRDALLRLRELGLMYGSNEDGYWWFTITDAGREVVAAKEGGDHANP